MPAVTSVLIGNKLGTIAYVNDDATNIVATFADLSGTGVDLDDGGSTITVTTESGLPAPGITTSNGIDQLTWTPIVLPADGSADGRYTVTVTPKDKAGRQGEVVYRQFVYDTQEPRVTASTPVSLTQPVTYISGSLTQLQFSVEDVGPAGLELSEQTIELLGPQGTSVGALFTYDEINSQLYLTLDAPLAQDGSADGEYLVKVSLVDQSGNMSESSQRFIYDSQVPRVASVLINTESPVALVRQQITEITESISSLTLRFEEAVRVDFANTDVSLVGPEGQSIPLNVSADGLTELTASFVALTQVGLYTLSVTPQDIAGNVAQGAIQYAFRLDFVLPSVSSVELGGQIGDVVFLNGSSDTTIAATLTDGTGVGLALDADGSSIVVTGPSNEVVPGQTRAIGANQLVWSPISLPTDGRADGQYTVAITPIDQAGRQGEVVHRQFIYDTQEPRLTAATPVSLIQPANYIGSSLTQLQF
ncbi:MAG: Ig-like domain repeat protein, partial [Proteobacteria bacterium]|nr:Ig-like domain repeat protein [Pseudomonadota bacterium]